MTTSRRPTPDVVVEAGRWAERLGARQVSRRGSLSSMCEHEQADGVLVVGAERVTYHEPGDGLEYFYHPGMARVRLHNIDEGRGDPMVRAMRLQAGDSVLDCTLGRASDAIVISHVVGETGRVVGVEVSPVIAQLTIHGLGTYEDASPRITAAMRRIEAHQGDHESCLLDAAESSFDVVYFDPVFHAPVRQSAQMKPLRRLADRSELSGEALEQAVRVARRCVVIKQRYGTGMWAVNPIAEVISSPATRVEYGVIDASGEG